ncbi:hypothetical protein [Staphylococcus phage PT1-1]
MSRLTINLPATLPLLGIYFTSHYYYVYMGSIFYIPQYIVCTSIKLTLYVVFLVM